MNFWDDTELMPGIASPGGGGDGGGGGASPSAKTKTRARTLTKVRNRPPKLRATTTMTAAVDDTATTGRRPRVNDGGRRPLTDVPLHDFEDELRIGRYGVDSVPFVKDAGVMKATLARDDRVLLHHVLSPRIIMMQYDFAMWHAGSPERCGGSLATVLDNLPRLVGKLVPLCGKLPRYRGDKENSYSMASHLTKLLDPSGGLNEYALHPVFVSVNSEYVNDQGGILLQGVVVSAMGFNAPMGHERRLVTGLGDTFDDTWAAMLVTHAYSMSAPDGGARFGGIPWAAINPRRTVHGRIDDLNLEGRNMFDDRFAWHAYMTAHPEDTSITKFALTESKQVKGLLRRLLPTKMTLRDAAAALTQLRSTPFRLGRELASRFATLMGQRDTYRRTLDKLVGNDIRKCLLAEMLLEGTPLEGVWSARPEAITPPPLPDVHNFFDAVRSFLTTASSSPASSSPASSSPASSSPASSSPTASYQALYEQFYRQNFLSSVSVPETDDDAPGDMEAA
jgi:hypothetical protein